MAVSDEKRQSKALKHVAFVRGKDGFDFVATR
jgi:hypothetical protein